MVLLVVLRSQLHMDYVFRRPYEGPERILQLKNGNLQQAKEFL